jgi:glycosyltransferase involved in cell wall biosynthesis
MPTAVLDVDLAAPPEFLTIEEEYDGALVLVRWEGRPIGAVRLAVDGPRIDTDTVVAAAQRDFPDAYWEHWLSSHLHAPSPRPAPVPAATVAVCTRDRPDDLARCLESIAALPDDGQEVLVVDSCSTTDATARVATDAPGVRYVRADRAGLDIARNVAVREAKHEIVAFCDDDARVDRAWLRALLSNFDDPCVLAVTGLTMPLELDTAAQEHFEHFSPFGRGFQRAVYDLRTIDVLDAGALGAGANMALRRSAVSLVGDFDEALDAGTATRSGGDTDMFRRVLSRGYRVVYEPSALSWHRHRRTWRELVDVEYGYGVGVYAYYTAALFDGELRVPARVLRGLREWHLPQLVASLTGRDGAAPRDTTIAFSRGSLAGPVSYWRARRAARASRS